MSKTLNPAIVVDELGRVKAKIGELEKRESELREQLIETGVDEAEGSLFRATISRSFTTNVDRKTILEEIEGMLTPAQAKKLEKLIEKHTKESEKVTVKVTSR